MRFVAALSALSVLACVVACGSKEPDSGFGDGDGTGSDSNLTGNQNDPGSFENGSSTSSSSSGGPDGTCAGIKAETAKPKVDLIFVIDDSGSMTEEMNQIKTNVNNFAQKVGTLNLDYTVLFIVKKGTSGNTICVPPPLAGPNCADSTLFHHIDRDVQSNDSLKLILETYDSTTPALAWNKYLRMDAVKVFVEVSDDEATSPKVTGKTVAQSFEDALFAKAPAGMFGNATKRNYIFHSIISKSANITVTPTTLSNDICKGAANTSMQYQDLSLRTGGIMDEVCKKDYSGVLDNIAKGIGEKLGCEMGYPNAAGADPDKVVITYTPGTAATQTLTQVTDASKCDSVANAWYYDNNAAPTKIILCKNFCTTAQSTPGSKIEAVVGCKAKTPS